ncbi:MAG TPA: YcxB family protein [Bryobacteraceae bacterium]|jgi:YcxB-like protein|nr:YcxB family protein [Bryobacteraceae bacterium]
MTLVSLVGVVLALIVVVLTPDLEFVGRNGTPFLLMLAFWVFIATAPYFGAKRQMKTTIPLSASVTWIFSSQGIHRTGLHFSSDMSYEALWAARETKSLFLLYLGARSALVLPKRFFKDAAQQHEWRILIEERISPKRITKAGFLGRWL